MKVLGMSKSRTARLVAAVLIIGSLGGYLLYSSYAAEGQSQVAFSWGTDIGGVLPVGTDISQTMSLLQGVSADRVAIVSSTYYSSKYLRLNGISCASNIRCVSVTWPNFDNDPESGTYSPMTSDSGSTASSIANFAYDHKFSACVTKPYPLPSIPDTGLPLLTPHFTVVNNNKRFVIQTLVRYYIGGDCDINQGQTGSWYKTQAEANWYACYNNDGSDGPYYDGKSRNSCFDEGSMLPNGNDNMSITGGLSKPGSSPSGSSSTPGTGTSGGGATSAGNQNQNGNTVAITAQGNKQNSSITPSPFYDGRQFAAGSDVDKGAGNSIIRKGLLGFAITSWLLLTIILIICGVFGYLWWRYRVHPRTNKSSRANHA